MLLHNFGTRINPSHISLLYIRFHHLIDTRAHIPTPKKVSLNAIQANNNEKKKKN